ncbi:hypothetical protein ANCCAN_03357 [Ancylostoma caninum]|uniref:Uncharacterized protein n=1 Tax=Ancylostoma caninum TaxID=29170 RepID=A0A368H1K6_ANCCA|nr:hypothetical protein ANCCAN_03357 [Ancylostoma caninum]
MKKKAAAEDESLGLEMTHHYHKKGHVSRRDAIRRAIQVHANQEAQATMESVPDHLQFFWDGSLFVHRLEPTLHVYYNRNTIQMAARNGLQVLVADGVHSFQLRQLRREGQLYTVHVVCKNGVEVPLLHAISSKKTQEVPRFWDNVRNSVQSFFSGVPYCYCARVRFPLGSSVEQEARRGRAQGLPARDRLVSRSGQWWETIKRLVFLPRRLH